MNKIFSVRSIFSFHNSLCSNKWKKNIGSLRKIYSSHLLHCSLNETGQESPPLYIILNGVFADGKGGWAAIFHLEGIGMNSAIIELINNVVMDYQKSYHTETRWREPVIGFADAEDEKFKRLKQVIGPNHALPQDIISGAKSVIVYFLPFSEEIIKSNIPDEESSRSWDIANIDTNNLIIHLNQVLHDWIGGNGYKSSLLPPTYNYDEEKLISDWSHKSAAYVAGIGKFGVHHLLITEKGCCGRLGSIITDMKLKPSRFHQEEFCLFHRKGSCKACVKRCPNSAFETNESSTDYNRYKCNEQIYEKIVPIYPSGTGDACGKCMCNVPCSTKIPAYRN